VKILLLDIETSPYLAEVFDLRNVNIRAEQILRHSETICFAASWYHRKGIEFRSIYHDGKDAMVKRAWDLLDQADVVVHYYGTRFDIPKLNQEFLLAGLPPPSPYQQLDLYKTVKRFGFSHSSLGNALVRLGLTPKVKHEGQALWRGCLAMVPGAWRKMRRYNKGDVIALRELYDRLGPWILGHPNAALYRGANFACSRCGSGSLQKRGFSYKRSAKYQRYQCQGCGGWSVSTTRTAGTTTVPEV
jgi:hypothetical protein